MTPLPKVLRLAAVVTASVAAGMSGGPVLAEDAVPSASNGVAGKNVTLLGINSGTVAPNGTVYGSIGGSTESQYSDYDIDGSAELGFGVGDADEGIGAQMSVVLASLTDDFGDAGYLNFKLSRRISAGDHPTYIGLEGSQIGTWGASDVLEPQGTLAVTTFGRASFGSRTESYPYMLTLGAGTGLRNNQEEPGVIFGAGVGLTESFGVSAAWTGETVDVGLGFRARALGNASVTVQMNDVLDQEDRQRFTFTVNFAVNNLWGG